MILLVVDGGTDAITEKIISHTNEAAHICAQPKKENKPEFVSRYICVYFAKRNQPKNQLIRYNNAR